MEFQSGYKHQLQEDEYFSTQIFPKSNIVTPLIELYVDGLLVVKQWYAWDGASGPVVDRKSNFSASCAHDALYELLRKCKLPQAYRELVDAEYLRFLGERGKANKVTITLDKWGLYLAKGYSAKPKNRRKTRYAP